MLNFIFFFRAPYRAVATRFPKPPNPAPAIRESSNTPLHRGRNLGIKQLSDKQSLSENLFNFIILFLTNYVFLDAQNKIWTYNSTKTKTSTN